MLYNKLHCYNLPNFDENTEKISYLIDQYLHLFTNKSITTNQAKAKVWVIPNQSEKLSRKRIKNEDVKLMYEIYSKFPILKKKTLTIIKLYELTYFVLLYTFLLYSFYIYSVSVK